MGETEKRLMDVEKLRISGVNLLSGGCNIYGFCLFLDCEVIYVGKIISFFYMKNDMKKRIKNKKK